MSVDFIVAITLEELGIHKSGMYLILEWGQ